MESHSMRRSIAFLLPLLLAAAPKTVTNRAGTGVAGFSGDGGPGPAGQTNNPYGLVVGPDGALYFCEIGNHRVRRLDLKSHQLSTVAGTGTKGYSGDGGPALQASLNEPYEVRFDKAGNMFFVEMQNHIVRRVDGKTKIISTVAGTGEKGYTGDGGPATQAKLSGPKGIAYSSDGGVYIADTESHTIRRIDLKSGVITTVLGTGERGDGPMGAPLQFKLNRPHGIFIHKGIVYVADSESHRILLLK